MWATDFHPGDEPSATSLVVSDACLDPVAWVERYLGFTPDAMQARLLRSTAPQGILNCSRQWGKSTVAAAKAMHVAWTRPGSLVVVVSPSARQSGELVRKVRHFVRCMDIRPRGDGDNKCSVLLPNRSRIVGLPANEETIRGFSAPALVLVDEAARVSDEIYYMSVRPMLAAGQGSLWMMSTPFGQRGFFWETWQREDPAWERVRVTAEECPRITQEYLDNELETMGERRFRQEFCCEFVSQEGGIFDPALVAESITDEVGAIELWAAR